MIPLGIGEAVRTQRRARRWSQERLAVKVGRSRRTISRLERGLHLPTSDLVHAIERTLDIPPLVPGWHEPVDPGGPSHGPRIRLLRRSLGLRLDRVALAAGISVATLSRFERGLGGGMLVDGEAGEGTIANEGLAAVLGFASSRQLDHYCMAADPVPWLGRR